ncbi:MAG: dihydrofolate reductase [Bacteroidia bacterium]|jgi:dihydrofolate reductase
MKVSLIVAVAENGVIGKNNELPWRLSADLKHFKRITTGHHIIMGRKTFASIGKPLPNRTSVIITRQLDYEQEGCLVANSIEQAIELAKQNGDTEAFIIGGGQIYESSLELGDKIYLTRVHAEIEGDAFFPKLDSEKWEEISREKHEADEKNQFDYSFVELEMKD